MTKYKRLIKKRKREKSYVNKVESNIVPSVTPLGFNHPIAKRITQSVVEMTALDNQPFSVVDNTGFERLVHLLEPQYKFPSRHYFSEVATPDIQGGQE